MSLYHKYLDVAGTKPKVGEITLAEFAINVVDGIVYTADAQGNIVKVSSGPSVEITGRDPRIVPDGDWVVFQEMPETNEDWMGYHIMAQDLSPVRPYGEITPNEFLTGKVHTAKWRRTDVGDALFVFGGDDENDDQINGTDPIDVTLTLEGKTYSFQADYTTSGGNNLYRADGSTYPVLNDFVDAAKKLGTGAQVGIEVLQYPPPPPKNIDWTITSEIPETTTDWMGYHVYSNDIGAPFGTVNPTTFLAGTVHTIKYKKNSSGNTQFVFGGSNDSGYRLNGEAPIHIRAWIGTDYWEWTADITTSGDLDLYRTDDDVQLSAFIDAAIAAGDGATIEFDIIEVTS